MAPPRRYFERPEPQAAWIADLEDEERRDQQDDFKDPWGYDETTYPDYLREQTE